jgi:D-sedoheptulose 7-phosphate isomerase
VIATEGGAIRYNAGATASRGFFAVNEANAQTRRTFMLRNLEEHRELFSRLECVQPQIDAASVLLFEALARGRKLMFCGNGGSAADSQHLASEFTGRFINDRRPLAALALTTDSSALTCISNDYSFDDVFYRQVLGLGREGDCLIAISTSGNSRNVIRAAEAARAGGMRTIGLLGRDGGELRDLCDVPIVVSSTSTARIQEAHSFIGHTLCGLVEQALGVG